MTDAEIHSVFDSLYRLRSKHHPVPGALDSQHRASQQVLVEVAKRLVVITPSADAAVAVDRAGGVQ